jgi:hypothetical protein
MTSARPLVLATITALAGFATPAGHPVTDSYLTIYYAVSGKRAFFMHKGKA